MRKGELLGKARLFLLCLFMLASCTSPIPATKTGPIIDSTSEAEKPIYSPPEVVTVAPTMTQTFPTGTPFSLTSVTPISTLSVDGRESILRKLMENNAGCSLPCWWGTNPGKTNWQETEKSLTYLGIKLFEKPESEPETVFHFASYYFAGRPFLNSIGFIVRKGMVETIFARVEGSDNPKDFEIIWKDYSPQKVVSTYKIPSRVFLQASGDIGIGNTGNGGYILWIFYDYLGFMIRYDGSVVNQATYHICPNLEDTNIQMTLQSPNNHKPLEWGDGILTNHRNTVRTIEESSGISLEEFYQLFIQPEKPGCFETPENIWPKNK